MASISCSGGRTAEILQPRRLEQAGRSRLHRLGDGAADLGEARDRRLVAGLRAGPRLARSGERFEGEVGGAVGLGEGRLAVGEAVGGVLALRLGGLDLAHQGAAAGEVGVRRLRKGGVLAAGALQALGQIGGGLDRARDPLGPGADLDRDRIAPAPAQVGLVHQGLEGAPRLRSDGALLGDPGPLGEETAVEVRRRRQGRKGGLCIPEARLRLRLAGREAGEALLQGRTAGGDLGLAALRRGKPRAGRIEGLPGAPRRLHDLVLARGGGANRGLRGLGLGAQFFRRGMGRLRLALEVAEAVLLGQAPGGRGGRLGRRGVAVPAPEIALAGDEALARLQEVAQALALRAGNDADLAQAAGEGGRRAGLFRERLHALGQGGVLGIGAGHGPVGRGGDVGRGVEVLAEGGAERGLVALLDGDLVEGRRPKVARRPGEELRQGARLGVEALRPPLGLGVGLARALLGLAGVGQGGPGFGGDRLGGGCRGLGGRDLPAQKVRGGAVPDRGEERFEIALDAGLLGGEPVRPFALLADAALEGGAAGVEVGHLGLEERQGGLGLGEHGLGRAHPRLVLGADRFGARHGAAELEILVREPRHRRLGVGALARLAGDVAVEFGDVALEFGEALAGAALLVLEFGARVRQPLQGGGGDRLRLAQAGDGVRGDGLFGGGAGLRLLRGRDRLQVLLRLGLGGGGVLARLGEADRELQRLEPADLSREVLVADRLAALLLQGFDLRRKLAQDVLDADEIVLRRLEAQLRLVPAGVQPGDAGRILEDAAAGLRLGVDDLADLALADEGRGARAGGRVGEQDLHVAGAHLLAVDAVERALLALDPARDLEHLGAVEGRRRGAGLVVDRQHHLGGVARRPAAGAREDDVVHP